MSILAVLVIFQPFVDLAEAIIKFFAETVGLSWGLSIVALTLTVRAFTLPLSLTGIRSMRRMQLVAPELKALQAKYKDDRERQQREMLALYKRHGVNPLASCFPFLLQIPFFIAVYSLLRGDAFAADVNDERLRGQLPLRPRHPGAARGRGEVGADRALHQHDRAHVPLHDRDDADDDRSPEVHLPRPAAAVRAR